MKKSDFYKVNLIYFWILTIFIAVRVSANAGLFSFFGEFESYFHNLTIQVFAMFLLPLLAFTIMKKQKVKQTFKDFSFKKISLKAVLISLGIGVAVFVLNIAVSSIFSAIISGIGYEPSSTSSTYESYPFWLFLVSILFTGILPGFCEEFTHRGLLLFGNRKLGAKKAVIITALLFGMMHMNIEQCFYATLIGVLLGFMTVSTGSIFPAMIVHFMNNAINVYINFASANNLWLGNIFNNLYTLISTNFIMAFLVVMMVLGIAVVLLIALVYSLIKEIQSKNLRALTEELAKRQLRRKLMEGIETEMPEKSDEIVLENTNFPNTFAVPLNIIMEKITYPVTSKGKLLFTEKTFFIVNLFLTISITFCTFIWGIL